VASVGSMSRAGPLDVLVALAAGSVLLAVEKAARA
jgi:hypothetical protein